MPPKPAMGSDYWKLVQHVVQVNVWIVVQAIGFLIVHAARVSNNCESHSASLTFQVPQPFSLHKLLTLSRSPSCPTPTLTSKLVALGYIFNIPKQLANGDLAYCWFVCCHALIMLCMLAAPSLYMRSEVRDMAMTTARLSGPVGNLLVIWNGAKGREALRGSLTYFSSEKSRVGFIITVFFAVVSMPVSQKVQRYLGIVEWSLLCLQSILLDIAVHGRSTFSWITGVMSFVGVVIVPYTLYRPDWGNTATIGPGLAALDDDEVMLETPCALSEHATFSTLKPYSLPARRMDRSLKASHRTFLVYLFILAQACALYCCKFANGLVQLCTYYMENCFLCRLVHKSWARNRRAHQCTYLVESNMACQKQSTNQLSYKSCVVTSNMAVKVQSRASELALVSKHLNMSLHHHLASHSTTKTLQVLSVHSICVKGCVQLIATFHHLRMPEEGVATDTTLLTIKDLTQLVDSLPMPLQQPYVEVQCGDLVAKIQGKSGNRIAQTAQLPKSPLLRLYPCCVPVATSGVHATQEIKIAFDLGKEPVGNQVRVLLVTGMGDVLEDMHTFVTCITKDNVLDHMPGRFDSDKSDRTGMSQPVFVKLLLPAKASNMVGACRVVITTPVLSKRSKPTLSQTNVDVGSSSLHATAMTPTLPGPHEAMSKLHEKLDEPLSCILCSVPLLVVPIGVAKELQELDAKLEHMALNQGAGDGAESFPMQDFSFDHDAAMQRAAIGGQRWWCDSVCPLLDDLYVLMNEAEVKASVNPAVNGAAYMRYMNEANTSKMLHHVCQNLQAYFRPLSLMHVVDWLENVVRGGGGDNKQVVAAHIRSGSNGAVDSDVCHQEKKHEYMEEFGPDDGACDAAKALAHASWTSIMWCCVFGFPNKAMEQQFIRTRHRNACVTDRVGVICYLSIMPLCIAKGLWELDRYTAVMGGVVALIRAVRCSCPLIPYLARNLVVARPVMLWATMLLDVACLALVAVRLEMFPAIASNLQSSHLEWGSFGLVHPFMHQLPLRGNTLLVLPNMLVLFALLYRIVGFEAAVRRTLVAMGSDLIITGVLDVLARKHFVQQNRHIKQA